jgi:hypothetical protein
MLFSSLIVSLTVGWSTALAPMTQSDRPLVFSRVCNIEAGQEPDAEALAEEMVALVNARYPGAELTAGTGRWMTGFQSLAVPVNQIRFTEQHPDAESRDTFTAILLGDDDFEALQRKVADVVDFSSCTETQFRSRP